MAKNKKVKTAVRKCLDCNKRLPSRASGRPRKYCESCASYRDDIASRRAKGYPDEPTPRRCQGCNTKLPIRRGKAPKFCEKCRNSYLNKCACGKSLPVQIRGAPRKLCDECRAEARRAYARKARQARGRTNR